MSDDANDDANDESGEAITEPLDVTPSTLSEMSDWPDQATPRRDPFRSLSRRLLDDLHRPRPVRTRELAGLLLSLVVGLLLVSLLLMAVTPALFSSLFARFTGIPQRMSNSHVSIASTAPRQSATPTVLPTATRAPAVEGVFLSRDVTTQGSWQGKYGQSGAVILGESQRLPPGVQLTPADATPYTWAASTPDARALQRGAPNADRIAACWYAADTFSVAITIPAGQSYTLAVYLLDWDHLQRAEDLRLLDSATGAGLDTRTTTAFDGGVYLVWRVRGKLTLQVMNHPGSVNAVVSGLFFSPV
jgi:hypothetical protein